MSTAKEIYYDLKGSADKCFEGVRDPIHDYVTELEQDLKDSELRRKDLLTSLRRANAQKAELEQKLSKLKESQTQKSIIKLCNRVDKAEADKAELMKFVKEMNDLGKLSPMKLSDYSDIIYHGSLALLNKHTDNPDAL